MIRNAVLQDSGKIANIIVNAWQNAYAGIIDQSFVDNMEAEKFTGIMENNIQNKTETIFVYEEDEIIKGFISGKLLDESPYNCETVGFYILPEYQNQGIGKLLFSHIKKFFSGLNCRLMIAWTLRGAKNNSFYIKNGGIIMEYKKLEIGNKEYDGIGFAFNLLPVSN